ncbi:hypothetical protein ACGFNU_49210 [Spirillospora sp. NPDC048911]|uniref:hypothetical protein n=1 Tax=Spirillospora sp. NPDC048911 TaxID=3364527 RepID=UPI00371B8CC8
MRKSDRWSFVVLGVGVVVILGGVQVAAMLDESSPPLPSRSGFCPLQSTGAARTGTDYEEAADPYQGNGPHPLDLVLMHDNVKDDVKVDLPAAWRPGPADGPPRVQLVACGYQDMVHPQPKKRETCLYSHKPSPRYLLYTDRDPPTKSDLAKAVKVSLLETRYVFQVYEATTAKPLGRFEVAGKKYCPTWYELDSGGVISQEPDTEGIRKALRLYVERIAG